MMLYRVKLLATKFPESRMRNASTLVEADSVSGVMKELEKYYYWFDEKQMDIRLTTLYEEGRCVQCRKEMPNWPPDDESWKPDPDWGELKPTACGDGEWYCPECEGT